MLESERDIHGHVTKQLTNHSLATRREIAKEYRCRWFLSNNLVSRLVERWATHNAMGYFVAHLCCLLT